MSAHKDSRPEFGSAVAALTHQAALEQIMGHNPAIVSQIAKIGLYASCDAPVLIFGETGTGKEIVAQEIHRLSARSSHPFVPLNCAGIPLELVENELFGHEQGAFTGATRSQPGLVEAAEGGILFLDEIDWLAILAQGKLLRLLQERE